MNLLTDDELCLAFAFAIGLPQSALSNWKGLAQFAREIERMVRQQYHTACWKALFPNLVPSRPDAIGDGYFTEVLTRAGSVSRAMENCFGPVHIPSGAQAAPVPCVSRQYTAQFPYTGIDLDAAYSEPERDSNVQHVGQH